MRKIILKVVRVAVTAAFISTLAATGAEAQLTSAQVAPFVGSWLLPIEVGQTINLRIDIMDHGGHVMAEVSGAGGPPTAVESLHRSGENLILHYSASMQGQPYPIQITLAPNGSSMRGTVEVADGSFTASGTAARQQ